LLSPTRLGEWDTDLARRWDTTRGVDGLVEWRGLEQPPQPSTAAEGDLAVALEGPAEPLAELGAAHPQRDLAGEHQPLVVAQERRELGHPLQLESKGDQRVDLRARVDDLHLPLPRASERERPLQRGGHRAATGDRAAAVEHAREEALLERVGEVLAGGEPPPGARGREQLEHGLAVAVLQVLPAQAVAVGAQQPGVRGARHERNLLDGIREGAAG
jgi:hypothetical protein